MQCNFFKLDPCRAQFLTVGEREGLQARNEPAGESGDSGSEGERVNLRVKYDLFVV